jgi:hypothetical protein
VLAGSRPIPSNLCSSEISKHFLQKEKEKGNIARSHDNVGSRGRKEREKIYGSTETGRKLKEVLRIQQQ